MSLVTKTSISLSQREKINWWFTYDAQLPPSVGENQFSSIAGLTDALQTNPHQIKTYTVTEYRHFKQWKKKKMLMCISHLKIWHTHLIWAPPLRELRDLAVKLFWFENHKWKSLGHIDHNSTNINSILKFGTTQDHQTIIHIPIIKRVKKVRGRLRKRQYSKSDSKTTGGSITINCCSLYSLQ